MEDINENEILKTLQKKYQDQIKICDSALESKIKDSQICCIENNILSSLSRKEGFNTLYNESLQKENTLDEEIKNLNDKKSKLQTILDMINLKIQKPNA